MTITPEPTRGEVWNRIQITGVLELKTPLVLKDGLTRNSQRQKGKENDFLAEVSTVMRTADGRAAIPGSSLKGILRAYLKVHHVPVAVMERLFGRDSAPKGPDGQSPDSGRGGQVEFGWAYSDQQFEPEVLDQSVEQSVTIDRVTRTAADRRLFATDAIPTGTKFEVSLLGYKLANTDIAYLLSALEGFNAAQARLHLGAGTANDFGKADWKLTAVKGLSAAEIEKWVSSPKVKGEMPDYWSVAKILKHDTVPSSHSKPLLHFNAMLTFEGGFLVRDPNRKKSDKPDAVPRLWDDKVFAPARGIRGAIRSQMERIARTLNSQAGGNPVKDQTPGLIEALFGHPGGRTALTISNFIDLRKASPLDPEKGKFDQLTWPAPTTGQTVLLPREFVAIDRFTGGSAEHLKFDCRVAWRPQLSGTFSINLDDLESRCQDISKDRGDHVVSPAAVLGLFFLTLRDLVEGDISFGMGAAKGMGQIEDAMIRMSASATAVSCLNEMTKLPVDSALQADHPYHFPQDTAPHTFYTACVKAARQALQPTSGAPA